jgi:tetratricopeptide (TPR) repeat protein
VLARAPRRILAWGLAPAVLAVWIPITLARQGIWRDEVTLFVRSSLDNPGNARLRGNAVASIFQLPLMNSCFWLNDTTRLMQATASIPRPQAEAMLPTLLQYHLILPDESRLTAALIITYAAAGQISNAVPVLESAARQGSNDVQCWLDLGTAYALEGNSAKARQAWATALRLQPTNRFALEHLRALNGK